MDGLLQGELIVAEGCMRVHHNNGGGGDLIIWQPGYFLNGRDSRIEIGDQEGRVAAREGAPEK